MLLPSGVAAVGINQGDPHLESEQGTNLNAGSRLPQALYREQFSPPFKWVLSGFCQYPNMVQKWVKSELS